jgi:hypothetical protein
MQMGMRCFTRLINALSRKIDNHVYTLSLYFVWYNFAKRSAHTVCRRQWPPASQIASGLWKISLPWSRLASRSLANVGPCRNERLASRLKLIGTVCIFRALK